MTKATEEKSDAKRPPRKLPEIDVLEDFIVQAKELAVGKLQEFVVNQAAQQLQALILAASINVSAPDPDLSSSFKKTLDDIKNHALENAHSNPKASEFYRGIIYCAAHVSSIHFPKENQD